jgi:hypothetical protein
MLQLWEGWVLCQGMLPAKVGQLTSYSITYGKSAVEPAERPSITVWLCQLHHCGGDTHGSGVMVYDNDLE